MLKVGWCEVGVADTSYAFIRLVARILPTHFCASEFGRMNQQNQKSRFCNRELFEDYWSHVCLLQLQCCYYFTVIFLLTRKPAQH